MQAANVLGCELIPVQCDISDFARVQTVAETHLRGIQAIIHLAALVGPFFPHKLYTKVNFDGTKNLIEAAKSAGVPVFVDCSSPSTRFDGQDVKGKNESMLPYAHPGLHEYARTKALGEEYALKANSSSLSTCAVGPHQVYGPSDQLFLPAFIRTAVNGRLRVFGEGEMLCSFTHIDNVSYALYLCACSLYTYREKSPAAGEFFFVTDGGCRNFWDVLDSAITHATGLPSLRTKYNLPLWFMTPLANISDFITKVTGKKLKLNSFTLKMLVMHRYFSIQKLEDLVGYRPLISFDEGWKQTIESMKIRLAKGDINGNV